MKKIPIIIYLLLLTVTPIFAQTEEEGITYEEDLLISDNEPTSENAYFDLELTKGTQNPITKEIPFTLYITPKIDSTRTQILWDIPTVFSIKIKHSGFVSLKKDITYTFEATVKPDRAGAYDITVNVISWQHDTNKTNSVNYTLVLNDSLTAQPIDSQYTLTIILLVVGIIILVGISIYILTKSIKGGVEKLKKWLTPPF